jgi:hypothetical protein
MLAWSRGRDLRPIGVSALALYNFRAFVFWIFSVCFRMVQIEEFAGFVKNTFFRRGKESCPNNGF